MINSYEWIDDYVRQLNIYFDWFNIKRFCEITWLSRTHFDNVLNGNTRLKTPYVYALQEAILTRQDMKQDLGMDLCDRSKYKFLKAHNNKPVS